MCEITSVLPLVELYDNIPTTTSLNVSDVFNKGHNSIMRDIRNLIKSIPENFGLNNFVQSSYKNQQGREMPMYTITRDGFTLLVMGYTGKEAIKFKLAYIEAFNAMEQELKNRAESSPHDRKPLNALVGTWVGMSGQTFPQAWKQLNAAFNIRSISELPESWIPDAVAWVQERIDKLHTPALPEPVGHPDCEKQLKEFFNDYDREMARIEEKIQELNRQYIQQTGELVKSAARRLQAGKTDAYPDYFIECVHEKQFRIRKSISDMRDEVWQIQRIMLGLNRMMRP